MHDSDNSRKQEQYKGGYTESTIRPYCVAEVKAEPKGLVFGKNG